MDDSPLSAVSDQIRTLMGVPTTGATDILTALQNAVQAINNLNTTMGRVFPQAGASSSLAPAAGTITFTSSQAAIFLSVLTSSGGTYRIPGY